ncbi:hypothetical protein LCGC14_0065300 [marine sediment metagenome]|uniref:DUF2231 domain-containing protein n=1 Tax=marine sediment metagenome TaxID=412755 RepID=A0A0F9Y4B0_9ZZZZ
MTATVDRPYQMTLHPVHAVLLAGTIPLFLGATLSDFAYSSSYQIQWTNFASWLIAGGLVFCGFALLCAIIGLFRAERRGGRTLVYLLLLLAAWILGFLNALIHAKDVWASMPMGLILSVIVTVLVCAATWIGFSGLRVGGAK